MGSQPMEHGGDMELLIRDEAERLGIPITDDRISRLLAQLRLVLEANRQVNLTAIRDPREACIKHVIDSLYFYPAYHAGEGRYLDLGTGAGYPGMVLEVLEPREGVLLDSVAKKIDVCERIGSAIGLRNVRYVAERVETFARAELEAFGVVTARAVAPMDMLLEYAQPLLAMGGILIMGKGALDEEEAAHGTEVAELLGFARVSRETFSLPESLGSRTILTYRKVKASPIALPRRVGRAKKQPLWKRKNVSRET